jgi:hypothetical protein
VLIFGPSPLFKRPDCRLPIEHFQAELLNCEGQASALK